jgi:hypothetical protein
MNLDHLPGTARKETRYFGGKQFAMEDCLPCRGRRYYQRQFLGGFSFWGNTDLSPIEDGLSLTKPPQDVCERPTGLRSVVKLGKLLSENSLLPIGKWDAQVATLSVFLRTGWFSRQLTLKELAVSFDLPVALHKE